MPRLLPPVVPAGSLAQHEQPTFDLDDRVQLRPWEPHDAASLRSAFADPEIQRWHGVRMDSQIEADEWIAETRSGWRTETVATWAIAVHDRSTAVGSTAVGSTALGRISLYFKDLRHGLGEVAYWVRPEARGARLAPRATSAVTDWAFSAAGLHRIELLHSTQNAASCRVAEHAGFVVEGTRRSAMLHLDGWHDMHLHSCIPADRRS